MKNTNQEKFQKFVEEIKQADFDTDETKPSLHSSAVQLRWSSKDDSAETLVSS